MLTEYHVQERILPTWNFNTVEKYAPVPGHEDETYKQAKAAAEARAARMPKWDYRVATVIVETIHTAERPTLEFKSVKEALECAVAMLDDDESPNAIKLRRYLEACDGV